MTPWRIYFMAYSLYHLQTTYLIILYGSGSQRAFQNFSPIENLMEFIWHSITVFIFDGLFFFNRDALVVWPTGSQAKVSELKLPLATLSF